MALVFGVLLLLHPTRSQETVYSLAPSATPPATATPRPVPPTPSPAALPAPLPAPQHSAPSPVLAYPAPPIQARAAILIDMETGKVLYVKHPNERLPMASTTKITTAVLALRHGGLNQLVTVSRKAATIGESTMALVAGERVTVRQLLYGLLLNSGNDAAIALAEHTAGSVRRFVSEMNQLARTLHMRNTHYVTPHGLDEPGHYTSARDLATIALYAMRDPTFRKIVATESYYVPPTRHNRVHWLANINHVLYWYPGVNGVKPGDTDNAGLCQVVSVHRDGKRLLAVLLNTPNLYVDIRNLLNFGLRDFRWVKSPAWLDGPESYLAGGHGKQAWLYYFGSGHYIRGTFLAYFRSHGGLATLGYPRTEQIELQGARVQFFQNAQLIYDRRHHSVYPLQLGSQLAARLVPGFRHNHTRHAVLALFRSTYRRLGGAGNFGLPISGRQWVGGEPVQLFQYGDIGVAHGAVYAAPLGDAALRMHGWLPVRGAADSTPPSLSWNLIGRIRRQARIR